MVFVNKVFKSVFLYNGFKLLMMPYYEIKLFQNFYKQKILFHNSIKIQIIGYIYIWLTSQSSYGSNTRDHGATNVWNFVIEHYRQERKIGSPKKKKVPNPKHSNPKLTLVEHMRRL